MEDWEQFFVDKSRRRFEKERAERRRQRTQSLIAAAIVGVVVLGDGSRVEVKNTEELRSKVLAIAEKIREHRRTIREEIPVRQPAAKCRACGQRGDCGRAVPIMRREPLGEGWSN